MRREEAKILKFLTKTALYGAAPELFSRVRSARALRGSDISEMRPPAFQGAGEIAARQYGSYGEYVKHQAEKYRRMLGKSGGLHRRALVAYRLKFVQRFRPIAVHLPHDAVIVCAGARDGTEVEVWRDLGFPSAIGYDLNPGPNNPFVLSGDFNHLPAADASAHVYYTNAVDHAYDLDMMFSEARRVVRPGGFALFDIGMGDAQQYEAVSWKRPELVLVKLIDYFPHVELVRRWRQWMYVTMKTQVS